MTDFDFSELHEQRAYGSSAALRDQTIARIFDDNARRWPDRVALVLGDESLTYAELAKKANAVASHLRSLGVGRGSFVAICMPRSIESAVCILAVVKAGGAYVPLDPEYPEPRLRFMLEDSGAKHLLIAGSSKLDLSGSDVETVDVARVLTSVRDERLHDINDANDIACVLYTSGSTGKPKGVLIRNTSIVGHVCDVNWVQVRETDRVAQLNNLSFDPTTTEVWGAWLNGAALVVLPVDLLTDSRALAREIRSQRLTHMFIPAGLLRIHAANAPEMFGPLDVLASGGEAADPEVFARILRSASPPKTLLNVYGPTEATTQVTYYVVPKPIAANGNGLTVRIPIGSPVTGAKCLILDEQLHAVAAGETGELCIGGRPLSAGYLNRPELNAEKFIADPTSRGDLLYRTGDLARWTDDGNIDLLGRNDEQIKRRDFRIEPGEVQAALNGLPGVAQSYVMQREAGSGSTAILVAYLVLSDSQSQTTLAATELRRNLRATLPAASIPDKFVVLPGLPLTPNGKVDRAALPAPEPLVPKPTAAAAVSRPNEESSRILAADRPRSSNVEIAWRRISVQLEPSVVEIIREATRAFDASTHDVLFAAWQLLLTRWTGEPRFDVALLSRVEGPSTALLSTETILPCDLSADDLRFAQIVASARDLVAAEARPSAPPLAPDRRTQIGFAFVEVDASNDLATPNDAGLELALEVVQGSRVIVSAHYRDDLFERATAESLLQLYVRLMSRVVELQSSSVADIELISTDEQAKLLHGFNDTAQPYPSSLQVQELFEQCARTSPSAVAILYDGNSITYDALNRRANQLARYLRDHGVQSEVRCGIALQRSTDMVVAMLAVWKAGGCYVPLDPDFPRARLELMLTDSAALVVITDSKVIERLPDLKSRSILLDKDREAIARCPDQNVAREGDASGLAYVIYTSGSTGKPKGVMITHTAAVNFLTTMQKTPGMTRQDRLLAVTTLSFDIALLELCVPLITGAAVVIATAEQRRDPHLLRDLLDRCEISLMQATPTMWTQLVASGWQGSPRLRALVGGEALSTKLAVELETRCSEVWNLYGPTETTVWSTRWLVDRPEQGIFIGAPIANTRCLILDRNQRLAPIGAFGELYIGGAGVARGYLNRDDLTAQRFIPNPYVPAERLYRTGDRARWRAAGVLEFAGRLDRQIKLRGFRIEIGEIESVLDACEGVDQSVVVVREDRPGDPRLIAYVVGRSLDSVRLRQELALRLPQHMLPSSIVVLRQLPLTPNAKVDVNALPSPADSYSSSAVPADDAMDDIERRLAHEWEEILNYKPVGLDDDFFELGGHSLLALALLLRVQERFGKRLTLASFLEHPTVRAQAKLLRETHVPIEGCSIVPIQARGSKLPLFFASGWGGPILALHELARRLGADQPLYLLDYFGHGRAREHEPSIEQIASELVQHMRAIQPRGPYLLVGYSLGAKVVYEMGYQLFCAGETEVGLILLDSYAPGHPLLHSMSRRLWLHGRKAVSQGPVRMVPYLLRRIAGLRRKVIDIEPVLYRRDAGEVLPEMVAEYNHFGKVIYRASKRYQFKKYPASLVLIRAQDMSEWGISAREDDFTGGWTDWVRSVISIGSVPSVHTAMLKVEHSARLAELLEQSVERLGLTKDSDYPAAAPDLHAQRGAL